MHDYDVIVVGAGNGGLAAGTALAQSGLKVLILERHNIPGGSATTFCRGRFEFEVALHQLSDMGTPERPGTLRTLLDSLGVLDEVSFVSMEDLYRVVIPDRLDVTLPVDRQGVVETLQERFPAEKEAIKKFFDLVYGYGLELYSFYRNPGGEVERFPLLKRYAFRTAGEVMDEFFQDPLLKAVPGAYWGYIGLTPNRLPFSYLSLLYVSYIEMLPCHVKGGSQSLSNAMFNRFLSLGGEAKFNCGAKKIVVRDGVATGVLTDRGEEISARFIVSNASKVATFTDLIDPGEVPNAIFEGMKGRTPSPSSFNIYMGLDCEPGEVGITASTTTILPDEDMSDRHFNQMRRLDTENSVMGFSCYDVADPTFSPPGACQVALLTLRYAEPWLRVPPSQYAAEKYRCAETMLRQMERVCPGVRDHIEEIEVATPLTFMRYLNSPYGAIYGFEQYMKDSLFFEASRQMPIKGLYLAGGWVTDCGFAPTIKSGVSAAGAILRQAG